MSFSCSDSCLSNEEVIDYSCNNGQYCCKPKIVNPTTQKSSWWIWVLVLLIIVIIAAIAYVKREQLKLEWFKLKTRFRKDRGGGRAPVGPGPGSGVPQGMMPPRGPPRFPPHTGFPAKPGFPPIRRPQPPAPPRQNFEDDKEMSEVFKKLRDMSE
jgi:hypothetical protein